MRRQPTCAPGDADHGAIAVVAALAFLPLALVLAVVVDAARVWVVRERLQNAVETAATASVAEWVKGGQPCSNAAMFLLTADGADVSTRTCTSSTSSTAHTRTVRVRATEDVPLQFARLLGRSSVEVAASTGVRISPVGALPGLWPFALCADNQAVTDWINSGFASDVSVTIRFKQTNELCRGDVSGNWAVIDFDGGSSSNSETKYWVDNGYTGVIHVGDVLEGSPGAPSSSLDISSAIGREVLLPLYRYPTGTGSGARYTVVGIALARVDALKLDGSETSRSITITFLDGTTKPGAGSGDGPDYGLYKWGVCSLDNHGAC